MWGRDEETGSRDQEARGFRGQGSGTTSKTVIPAKAGIQTISNPRECGDPGSVRLTWIPAFAGMTVFEVVPEPCQLNPRAS